MSHKKEVKMLEVPEGYSNLYVIISLLKTSPALILLCCSIGLLLIFLVVKTLFSASNLLYL